MDRTTTTEAAAGAAAMGAAGAAETRAEMTRGLVQRVRRLASCERTVTADMTEEQSGKHANVGAIAGGIIGGLVRNLPSPACSPSGRHHSVRTGAPRMSVPRTHQESALQASHTSSTSRQVGNSGSEHATGRGSSDGRYDLDDPDLVDITEASSHPIVTPLPAPEPKPDPGQGYK